jgi:hypothetical protein
MESVFRKLLGRKEAHLGASNRPSHQQPVYPESAASPSRSSRSTKLSRPASPSRAKTSDEPVALQSYKKTFRVRSIPHNCKRSEIEKIIKTSLGLEHEGPDLKVYSVASNPYRNGQEKVATINFERVPSTLSGGVGKDEWRFPLLGSVPQVFDGDDGENPPHRDTDVVLDTHFKGFTPLRSFQNAPDHKIEYVTYLQYKTF